MPIRYTPIAIGSLWGLPGGCDSQSSFHRGITAHPAGHHAPSAPETEAVAGRCVNWIGMLRSSLPGDRTSIMAWHRQTQSIWIPLVLYTYFGTWGHLVFCSCASAHWSCVEILDRTIAMSLSRLRREAKKAYSDPALISHGDVRYPNRCLVRYTAFSVCLAVLLVSRHVSFES